MIKGPMPGGSQKGGKWGISVSPVGGASLPLLVLTAPNGTVYDDSIRHRWWMFQASP